MIVLEKSPVKLDVKFPGVLLVGILGYMASRYLDNVWVSLVVLALFSLVLIVVYNDRRFTSPISIFVLFYYPYSTWYAYSLMFGSDFYDRWSLIESLHLAYIGLLSFFVAGIFTASVARSNKSVVMSVDVRAVGRATFRGVMIAAASTLLAASFVVIWKGAASKREILNAGYMIVSVAGFAAVVLAVGAMLGVMARAEKSGIRSALLSRVSIVSILVLLLAYLVLGERDYIFRALFGLVCLYFCFRRNANFLVLLGALFALVLFLPVTQAMKGALLPSATVELNSVSDRIFSGELGGASRNTYMLIKYGVDSDIRFLRDEVIRGLVPFGDLLGTQSSTSWFNRVFRVDNGFSGRSGWGFTLVGDGYLIAGVPGVVFVMALLSVLLHSIYFRRGRSEYWYVFYILCLSGAIYCIRADLANMLSQIFKVAGLSVLLFWLANRFARQLLVKSGGSDEGA